MVLSSRALLAAVLGLAAVVAFHGTASLPLDGHEALVVETAQEMHDRREWIVPYYNQEPRLSKPPLSYWLTELSYELAQQVRGQHAATPGRIEPWHGRLPSVLSGLALLVVVFVTARTLFDETTALLASLLTASSVGFFGGTHDARCDLLYSLLCATGLAGFVRARDEGFSTRAASVAIVAMWVSFGLASLAKGPHVPLIFLAAIVLFCALRTPDRLGTLRGLRPVSGAILATLLSAPWWILLHRRVGPDALRSSQLSGSLLTIDWRHVLDPYYFYGGFVLALPWVALLPAVIPLMRRRDRYGDSAVLLALLYAAAVVLLSAGPQKRLIYMLPAWVPLTMLLAAGAVHCIRSASETSLVRRKCWMIAMHAVPMISAAVWLGLANGASTSSRVFAAAAVFFGVWILARSRARDAVLRLDDVVMLAVLAAAVFAAAGASPAAFEASRYDKVRLAAVLAENAPEGTAVAAVALSPSPYVYYAQRRIDALDQVADLPAWLERSRRERGLVLVATRLLADLPEGLDSKVLGAFSDPDPDDATTLLRIWRPSRAETLGAQSPTALSAPPR